MGFERDMRKVVAMIICFVGAATIFAQEEVGVVINGVTWATRNVDVVGTFAERAESPGMFYQWNRKKALSVTGSVVDCDASIFVGALWEAVNDPSPDGWRVPTRAEIEKLLDVTKVEYEWVTESGVNGGRFTDKATGKNIFLPSVKVKNTLGIIHGHYWSRTDANGHNAYHLNFGNGSLGLYHSDYKFGFSIRSVKDIICGIETTK